MNDPTPAAGGLSEHRICNARHGQVACYCSALTWMTLDEYGEHIEGIAAASAPSEAEAALRDERNHWIGESKRYERLYRRANEDAIRLFKQRNEARETTDAADREVARVTAAVEALADECASSGCVHLNEMWGKLRAALSSADTGALDDLLDRERAKAWDEGVRTGTSRAMRKMSDEPGLPLASGADNPYRAAAVSPEGGEGR